MENNIYVERDVNENNCFQTMDNIKLSTGISERTHREERESSLKIWRAPLSL